MKDVIVLFGKPGAGKGTRLSEFLDGREEQYEVLAVSALLKKARAEKTEIGKEVASYMDTGKLVPNEIINKMVVQAIKDAEKNIIIDGFPRTCVQAEAMLEAGISPNIVIEFYVEDEVVLERARDRIVCEKCGEPYTTNEFKRPKQEGICDKCLGKLIKRKDDEESVVRKRLEIYQEETYPVLKIFEENNVKISTIISNGGNALKQLEELLIK